MPTSSTRRDRPRRYPARLLIQLDAEAEAQLEALSTAVDRLPSQVLRQLIDWGLHRGAGWRVDRRRVVEPSDVIVMRLEPEVRMQVHAAARATGGDASVWVCHLLHQVTLADLPEAWQTGEADPRGHDSRYYGKRYKRYMMRLDAATWAKLEDLSRHFKRSVAEVIRQLVAHVDVENFPPTWQRGADVPRTPVRRDRSTWRKRS